MLTIIAITTPIFIMIILGYLAVRVKLVPGDTIAGMAKIVMYFTLPALIFSTLARMEFDEVIVPAYIATYAIGSILTLLIGLFISLKVMKRSLIESTLKGHEHGLFKLGILRVSSDVTGVQQPSYSSVCHVPNRREHSGSSHDVCHARSQCVQRTRSKTLSSLLWRTKTAHQKSINFSRYGWGISVDISPRAARGD